MTTQPARMRNHWWWRPGWSHGRSFYTWHLTFGDQPDVHRLADDYRRALGPLGGLDLIPDRWLHLTMQGIGFVDDVDEHLVRDIVDAAAQHLGEIPAFEITLTGPVLDPEAVLIPVHPAEPVRAVRDATRAAITEVVGDAPESADGFVPHVSVAYSSSDGPAAPYAAAMEGLDVPPATARVDRAELIVLNRDNRMYEWERFAGVPLG